MCSHLRLDTPHMYTKCGGWRWRQATFFVILIIQQWQTLKGRDEIDKGAPIDRKVRGKVQKVEDMDSMDLVLWVELFLRRITCFSFFLLLLDGAVFSYTTDRIAI